jgi:hypothetical protein
MVKQFRLSNEAELSTGPVASLNSRISHPTIVLIHPVFDGRAPKLVQSLGYLPEKKSSHVSHVGLFLDLGGGDRR